MNVLKYRSIIDLLINLIIFLKTKHFSYEYFLRHQDMVLKIFRLNLCSFPAGTAYMPSATKCI